MDITKHQNQQRRHQRQLSQTALVDSSALAAPTQAQAPEEAPASDDAMDTNREPDLRPPVVASKQTDLISTLSPVQTQKEPMSRLTKWLCAIIFALILVVLVLVLCDGPLALRNSRAQKLIDRLALGNGASGGGGGEASSKLLASSSENHYLRFPEDEHDSDEPNHGQNNNQNDDDSSTTDLPNQIFGANQRPNKNQRHHQDHLHGRPAAKIQRDPDSVCMTPGCVRAAAQILNNMDNRTMPCEDFYQFACGRWIETQLIPDEKSSLSVFSQNTADLNQKLRALIERPATDDDPPIVGQMRNMYASCMNLTDIEARGDEPLLEVLREFGGWPVIGGSGQTPALQQQRPARSPVRRRSTIAGANSGAGADQLQLGVGSSNNNNQRSQQQQQQQQPAHWLETIIKFRQRGFSHDMIIDLSVVPDVRNSRRYIIELDQSSLGLPDRSYYFKGLNDSTVAAYYKLMVESAVMLGASRDEARRQMAETLDFETALAKISVPREQRRNVTRLYNKMLTRDLYSLAPNIDWRRYLSALLKDNQLDMNKDEVIVKVPNFLRAVDALLVETEPRIVTNYMIWRIVRHSMSGLSRKWRELAHSYSTVTTGRRVEEPRWEQCLGSLDGTLGSALSALYVKNHFNRHAKAAALEMVDYIRGEFLRILDEIDWMDEETREEARLKARAIAAYIGYPDELLRDELIEQLYEGVELARTNFYENIRSLRIWSTDYAFGQLRKVNKRGDWKKHARAAVVNAYYNSLENSIEFPAGILQGAFFDAERPSYMNFGAIGYVIGHEITHGFDDRGRQFDRDGNDRNWWKPKTDARFRERAQCIIEQYGNYTVPENGLKVNGVNTQGENIADNGGIKEAFRAYRRWTKDHGREARLPGLEYSPDQLFWISAANIWCGKFRPEMLKLRVNSGVHSPARFRIIGPLSNSAEFAQSFNCPTGSPMNPHKKCSVW